MLEGTRLVRAAWLLDLLERALQRDPYLFPERRGDGLTHHVEPAVDRERTAIDVVWTTGSG